MYSGLAWLFLGVANTDALLYDDEWQEVGAAPCTCSARAVISGSKPARPARPHSPLRQHCPPNPSQVLKSHPDNFKLDYALSREQKNKDGGKMYIQDKVAEYADEVFTRMDNGGHMYFCGLKGMMPGILDMLEGVSKEKGIVWEDKLKSWKSAGQWHVEVY